MKKKNGFTLLEVTLAMIALTVAAVSMKMLMPVRESQSMQAVAESRKLISALRMARQIAVARQTQVRVRLIGSPRQTTGFVVERMANGSYTPVLQESILPTATANSSAIVFSPTGSADRSLQVGVGTGTQVRQIQVLAGSGMVRRNEP